MSEINKILKEIILITNCKERDGSHVASWGTRFWLNLPVLFQVTGHGIRLWRNGERYCKYFKV